MHSIRRSRRARQVSSNSADFPTFVGAEIDPSFTDAGTAAGRVVTPISLLGSTPQSGGNVPSSLSIVPFATGADNNTFSIRVIGYRAVLDVLSTGKLFWQRLPLAVLACTVGSLAGVGSGTPVPSTDLFVDTIALSFEGSYTADVTRGGSIKLFSPANNTIAHVIIALDGCEAFELEFDQTAGTPAMNALVTPLDMGAF